MPYSINHEIAFQTRHIHHHLAQFLSIYPAADEMEKKLWLVWMMRRFLRLGMELVMVAEQRFTRDLYLCYESFAAYYPAQAGLMFQALELAVNPRTDAEVVAFAERFGSWLVAEAREKLIDWGYQQDVERE